MLKKWLREPLLHFLVIGAVIFLIYSLQNDGLNNNGMVDDGRRIVISESDINRLAMIWQKKMQRSPTRAELEGLIEQQVREEVMYREALTMGLDKNDSIVRRRLAQKIEFISNDLAAQVEPTDKELSDYLVTHAEKFEIPGRISFVQIYFNSDRRGKQAKSDALKLLNELKQTDLKTDPTEMGDPFMMGQQHEKITKYETSRLYGKDFAKELFSLPTGHWQGPVSSGYGFHLVRIEKKTPSSQPELETVREKVKNEWFTQQRHTINENFYISLRQQYEILIEDTPGNNDSAKDNNVSTKE